MQTILALLVILILPCYLILSLFGGALSFAGRDSTIQQLFSFVHPSYISMCFLFPFVVFFGFFWVGLMNLLSGIVDIGIQLFRLPEPILNQQLKNPSHEEDDRV